MQVSNILPFGTLAFVWPTWLIAAVTVIFLAVCVVMVLTVLIQKPQGGGLASAFGGGASAGQTAFGTKTGDALTVFTIAVFVLYLICAVVLNYAARPQAFIAAPTAEGTPTTAPANGTQPAPTDGTQPAPADSKPADGTSPAAPATTPADPATAPGGPGTAPAADPAPTTPPAPTPGNPAPAPANTEPKTNPGR